MQRLVIVEKQFALRKERQNICSPRVFNADMLVPHVPDVARLATFSMPLARLKRNF